MLPIHKKNMFEHYNLANILLNKRYIFYKKKKSPKAWRDATPNSTSTHKTKLSDQFIIF